MCVFVFQGRLLSRGMDDGQEQDNYEERLKDVFNSFDTSGCGSLSPEELSDLCQSLQLDDATPTLLHTLLQNQDPFTARVRKRLFNLGQVFFFVFTNVSINHLKVTQPKLNF